MSHSTPSSTNVPSFIDTAACLCGLLNQKSSLPVNGEQIEMWRCIGDASANINSGGNGKWYNTSLPSQELSGINKPQNWGDNPPDLSQAYVLEDHNGMALYAKLGSGGSPDLIGKDVGCTGKNDTMASTMYYAKGNGTSNSTMMTSSSSSASGMSSSSSSPASSATGMATSGSVTTTSGASTSAATGATTSAGSTSASASAPKGTSSSAAPHFSLSSALLVGMVLAPLASLLM